MATLALNSIHPAAHAPKVSRFVSGIRSPARVRATGLLTLQLSRVRAPVCLVLESAGLHRGAAGALRAEK